MNFLSLLNQESFQIYNRDIARYCKSVNAAILFADLVNRFDYHSSKDEIIFSEKHGDGWFYYTIDKCEERTVLTRREQETAIKILKELGLIEVVNFGLPAKRNFRLKTEKILEIFNVSKKVYSLAKNANLECPKTPITNVGKRQSSHISKELYKTTSTKRSGNVVDVVEKQGDSEEKIDQNAARAEVHIEKQSEGYGADWKLSKEFFVILMSRYGINYVCDQLNYMLAQQKAYVKNDCRKERVKPVTKPASFLRLSCEQDWALSKHAAKS